MIKCEENYNVPDEEIDSLFICQDDWANTGFRFTRCLNMIGIKAKMLKRNKHSFNYPIQAETTNEITASRGVPLINKINHFDNSRIKKILKNCRVIHFHASNYNQQLANFIASNPNSINAVVQHGGTTYRRDPSKSNKLFNPITDATIIQCPDLLNLGAKNEHLIYYPVDTDLIQPTFRLVESKEKIKIGHFPSTASVKGSPLIIKAVNEVINLENLKDRIEYIGIGSAAVTASHDGGARLPWVDHLERVRNTDIMIETVNTLNHGKKFGEWGNTALECAALGKIVITNTLTSEIYKEQYGDCALHIANNAEELQAQIKKISNYSPEQMLEKQIESREWAVKNHSMGATAKRIWEKVYQPFFPDKKAKVESLIKQLNL
tara:strand:- start:1707 stop:2840 length:1134 start_codon:yes stop_codon:yes gene_type:complete